MNWFNLPTKLGYEARLHGQNEAYTSKTCWKCGERGTRVVQSYFQCKNSDCLWQGNADFNGSVNIAILTTLNFLLTTPTIKTSPR